MFLGDVNMPTINWSDLTSTDAISAEFLNYMLACGFSQCVFSPTRGSNILDLVFENTPKIISNVRVTNGFIKSDHFQVNFHVT